MKTWDIWTLDDIATEDECQSHIEWSESLGFSSAPITTPWGFVHETSIRNNTRVMVDVPDRAADLWARIAPHVPQVHAPGSGARWQVVGLNERIRVYRYEAAQYFEWHGDGSFRRTRNERSFFTAMLYLNDGYEGGRTEFANGVRVDPEPGRVLLFAHHLRHRGAPVLEGTKYVLRTDVMYRRLEVVPKDSAPAHVAFHGGDRKVSGGLNPVHRCDRSENGGE